MSKVMFDSELVQALSVLAQHAIEGMRKPPRIAEDLQWSPEESQAMANQKCGPVDIPTIASAIRSLSFYKNEELEAELKRRGVDVPVHPFVASTEQLQAVIRGAKTIDLQAELFRRNAIIPMPRDVKFGPVSDAECESAYKAWLVFHGNARKSMRPALEEFARSRGVL